MMVRLSKKTVYSAVIACVLVICAMVYVEVFVLGAQYNAVRSVDSRIKEVEKALVNPKTNENSNSVSKFKEELASAKQDLGRYVISSHQASNLTLDIDKIAKHAAVTNLRTTNRMQGSYGPINECQLIREGRIQINFKSSFSQFARFINLLELNEPVIFVDTFKIIRSTKNDGMHSVDMVLTFFVDQGGLTDIMAVGDFSNAPASAVGAASVVN